MGQDEGQFMSLPQGGVPQFAGGGAEDLTGRMGSFQSPVVQQQASPLQSIEEQQSAQEQAFSQPQEIQTLGQTQPADVMQESPLSQVSQQTSNDGVVTEMPENAKNYNQNAVIETTLSDNGYKVTTDAREKANNLAKDVKNFGLWEYSTDNTAASTDQTAKLLQSKLEEADALLKGKDSESLNSNQVANAQGSKVDDLLSLFNKGASSKGLENIQSETKGLEALDSATKGFTALGVGGKGLDLLGTGKSADGQLGGNDAALVNDVETLENSLGSQGTAIGGNVGSHEGVSVVTIPNVLSLEDEHGNKLNSAAAGITGNHKSEKQQAMQFLKTILKNKLESQAIKMLLKQRKLKAAFKPSASPTKSLKERLTMFLQHKDNGSPKMASSNGPKVSKLDVKLLKFIKKMLSKGIRPQKNKGLSEGQLKLFMSALKVMGKNNNEDAEEDKTDENETGKEKEAEKEKDADKEKASKNDKNEAELKNQKEDKKEDEADKNREEKVTDNEAKVRAADEEKKKQRAKKLKDIQALLEHVKPTSRSSHSFFMDEDQPLSDSEGMSSNSLLKYLEHETALLDQFQEGSQISDPALQLKQLAGLMMKVANKAEAKDEYVDARRTTVKPTDAGGEEGEKLEADDKAKGVRKETEKKENDKGKKEEGKDDDKEKKKEGDKEEKEKTKKIDDKEEDKGEKFAGKENEAKEVKNAEDKETKENKEVKEKENNEKIEKETKEESKGKEETEKGKQRFAADKEDKKVVDEKSSEKVEGGSKDEGTKKLNEKDKDGKDSNKEKESEEKKGKDKESKDESKNELEKVKEATKVPEVDSTKDHGKGVEKLEKGEKSDEKSSKYKDNEDGGKDASESKGKAEDGKDGKSDDEKVKQLKGLPELSKVRHNKKIVNKIDGNDEKGTTAFKGSKEDADQSTGEQNSHAVSEVAGKSQEKEGFDKKETENGGKSGSKTGEKTDGEKENRKEDEADKEKDSAKDLHQETTEQFDLYVASKSNKSSEKLSQESVGKGSEGKQFSPQLPFLNPGSAHLDVLESDASLKQYLMERGSKNGGLRNDKVETTQNDGESFDEKGNDRLLQLKDVTVPKKGDASAKPKPGGNINAGSVNAMHGAKGKPNIVPPAGQGIPVSTLKTQHTIKPMSRLQLQKYQQLMKYKKLMGERNHLKMETGVMESGPMRHIAPYLADRLVDAPSIRLAALARLISMAKRRQKMIDVTASKKTLPSPSSGDKYSPTNMSLKTSQTPFDEAKSMTSSHTSPEASAAKMTSQEQSSLKAVAVGSSTSMSPGDSVSPLSKTTNTFMSPVNTKSVLVPSSRQFFLPSFARLSAHEIETHPAEESSNLLSKAVVAERKYRIDPSDVTRSQLSKPNRPSITQVMNILGNGTGFRKNTVESTQTVDGKTTETKDQDDKMSGQIVKSFFKQPTQPATTISNSIKELGSMLKGGSNEKTTGRPNVAKSPAELHPAEISPAGENLKTREKTDNVNGQVNSVHDQEAGIASIRKQNTRNIVRTLKTDTSSADLLLRKRNEIPRVKRKLKNKRRKIKRHHS